MTRFLECGSHLPSSFFLLFPLHPISLLPHLFTLFFVFSSPHLFISSPPSPPPSIPSSPLLSPLCSLLSPLYFLPSFPSAFISFPLPLLSFPLQLLIMQTPNRLLQALRMGGTRISPKAAGGKRDSLLCEVQTIRCSNKILSNSALRKARALLVH